MSASGGKSRARNASPKKAGPRKRTRRVGSKDSESRSALLDAARQLMIDEGYPSVTARRVAEEAGLKPQLVHYYFLSMDDLFISLFRREADRNFERQTHMLASEQPLRSLWAFSSDRAGVAVATEFIALANHRKAIRAEVAAYADRFRNAQAEALSAVLDRYGVDAAEFPTYAVLVLVSGLSRTIVMEEALGSTPGHDEALALVERWLGRLEGQKATSAR